jgi:hypothetical protein
MRQISLFLSLVICGAIICSCNNITQKNFEFFYYPSKNVYYDVTNSLYLYSLDGGKTWDSLSVKAAKEPATLGSKQIIYASTPEVWKDNQQHINQYNGRAINITDSDSSSKNNLAADRKIRKPKAAITITNKQPEKKPGFFKRLFGKKN